MNTAQLIILLFLLLAILITVAMTSIWVMRIYEEVTSLEKALIKLVKWLDEYIEKNKDDKK